MFIITAKCSKRRVVKILLIFALLLSLFLALRACRHSSPPPATRRWAEQGWGQPVVMAQAPRCFLPG